LVNGVILIKTIITVATWQYEVWMMNKSTEHDNIKIVSHKKTPGHKKN
jgi:hypothetical protein